MKLYYHKTDGEKAYFEVNTLDDAEFVVRACTCHKDLLKAARIGRDWLTNYLNSIEDGKDDDAESDYQYIQAAIAEAEKGDG